MKRKTFITSLAFVAMALGVGTSVYAFAKEGASAVKADTPVTISTLAQLKTYFDGAGTNCGNSATLAADIDLNGAYVSGMAGEFSATFDGAGHKLYNGKVGANTSLFNIIGTAGIVKNLTLDVTVTGAVVRPLSYQNNGKIQGSTAVLRTGAASVNNVAAFAYLAGSGTYTNLFTDWVVDHTGADWLCSIYRDQTSTNVTGSYYTMNGSVASSADFQADGMTLSTAVNYLTLPSTAATVVGSSTTITPSVLGPDFTSVTYSSDNTSVATVANPTTGMAGIVSGLAEGTANITCTVVSAVGTFAQTTAVTVRAAIPVTAVSISSSASTIHAGEKATLSATLTGSAYDHISWSSSDANVATVTGSDTTATLTAVAAGTVTITATVYDASNAQLATNTLDLTISAANGFTIYFLDQQADNTTHNSASVFIYNDGDINNDAATRVANNGVNVTFRMADPADSKIKNWILWSYFVNTTVHTTIKTTSYVQLSYNGIGRWGGGMNLGTITEDIFCVSPAVGSSAPTKLGSAWTTANYTAAMTYAASTIYGGSWRVSDSICYKADNQTTLKTLLDNYDALATGVKTIAGSLNDSTTAYSATYGETIETLRSKYTAGSGSNTVQATEDKNNAALIAALAAIGVIALGAGAFIVARKKQH